MLLKIDRVPGDMAGIHPSGRVHAGLYPDNPWPGLPVCIPLEFAMVLFWPGYTFIAALLFRRADLEGLESCPQLRPEHCDCSSLRAWPQLYALGNKLTSVVLCLAAFTVAMAAIAYLRRMDVAREERFSIEFIMSRSAMFFTKSAEQQKREFLLYKEGNFTTPYRDLHLWVNVSTRQQLSSQTDQ